VFEAEAGVVERADPRVWIWTENEQTDGRIGGRLVRSSRIGFRLAVDLQ
jgi:hypothetical protein